MISPIDLTFIAGWMAFAGTCVATGFLLTGWLCRLTKDAADKTKYDDEDDEERFTGRDVFDRSPLYPDTHDGK